MNLVVQGARGGFGQFSAGQTAMEVSYDTEFVRALCEAAEEAGLPAGTLGERKKKLDHGTMVREKIMVAQTKA